MLRGEMLSTILRLTTSSANSVGVQWVTGRPDNSGDSQATTMIWQICSGVKVPGRPLRGSSLNTFWIRPRNSLSSTSDSASANCSEAFAQRARQVRTVGSQISKSSAIWWFRAPESPFRMIVARVTLYWGLRRQRTISSRMARCRSVS